MSELLTAAQMRLIERAAIASGAVTGLALMERAGQGVIDAILAQWPELAPAAGSARGAAATPAQYLEQIEVVGRAVVLCGPGNNGGDGFVVARLLRDVGWAVDVFLYGDAQKLPPDAQANYVRWMETGTVAPLDDFDAWAKAYDIGIDAVFGTGLSRPVEQAAATKIAELRTIDRCIAIDFPTGCCADSGRILCLDGDPRSGRAPNCNLTVTFQFEKTGHVLAAGPDLCGKVVLCDIGLDEKSALQCLCEKHDPQTRRKPDDTIVVGKVTGAPYHVDFMDGWSPLNKDHDAHKYTWGHALILSGGVGKGGAARLAARGALRIGAGAVTVGCPPAALIENAAQLNAVMLRKLADADALMEVLQDTRINALCLGPGLGTDRHAAAMLGAVLGGGGLHTPYGGAVCLDADALTILAADAALFARLHGRCVLTPHAGEFARLFPDIAERLNAPATTGPAYSKVDATREAAMRAGCIVLFKGHDTVIAAPDGRCSINAAVYDRAAPWLATAGSGDVLAGFITGLLARGFEPMKAAEAAAWLHVECARTFGPGLIAEDLSDQLPEVFRSLGM